MTEVDAKQESGAACERADSTPDLDSGRITIESIRLFADVEG